MSENSQSEDSEQDDPIYVTPWRCQGIDELRSSLQGAKEPWSQEGNWVWLKRKRAEESLPRGWRYGSVDEMLASQA